MKVHGAFGGKEGLQPGYALLLEFLQYVCHHSAHAKRLPLRVCVHSVTAHANGFLDDFEEGNKLALVRDGGELTPPHPAARPRTSASTSSSAPRRAGLAPVPPRGGCGHLLRYGDEQDPLNEIVI